LLQVLRVAGIGVRFDGFESGRSELFMFMSWYEAQQARPHRGVPPRVATDLIEILMYSRQTGFVEVEVVV